MPQKWRFWGLYPINGEQPCYRDSQRALPCTKTCRDVQPCCFTAHPFTQLQKSHALQWAVKTPQKLECGPMPNLMVALPNIGGALCSTPQSLADAHY